MLKQEFDAAEVEETEEVVGKAFVADDQAAKVAEVGEQPFDFPTPFIAPKLPTILRLGFFAVCAVWGDHVDVLFSQLGV